MNGRIWTTGEIKRLRELFPETLTNAIALELKRSIQSVLGMANTLGLKKSIAHLKTVGFQKGSQIGAEFRFKKGIVVWNKGKKGMPSVGRMKETQFKKGQRSQNELFDGAITVHTDHKDRHQRKYKWIRISKMKWKMLHVRVWQNEHGPVPKGSIIVFASRDTMNCSIENLRCITRQQHAQETRQKDGYIALQMASKGIGRFDQELRAELLKQPELLEAKRRQLQLNEAIRQKEHSNEIQ